MLYIIALVVTYFIDGSLCLWPPSSNFPFLQLHTFDNHKSDIFFYELCVVVVLDSTYRWGHLVFVFLCLTYFT